MDEDINHQAITDYSVIEIETSGLSETENEIIEIGAVKVKDGTIADTYTTIIRPIARPTNRIQEITHISDTLLKYAPSIDTVIPKLLEFIGDDIIVVYNANFTMKFLRNNVETINNKVIDTIPLAKQLFPELRNHKLSNVLPQIGITNFKYNATVDYAYLVMCLYEYYKNNERNQ